MVFKLGIKDMIDRDDKLWKMLEESTAMLERARENAQNPVSKK